MRTSFLRSLAAILMCLSGIIHIAALWLRELTGIALADALLGAVYLIIGIGLSGQSRFSLFMAIVIPGATIGLMLYALPRIEDIYKLRMTVDAIVILCSVIVLWRVRNHPSV